MNSCAGENTTLEFRGIYKSNAAEFSTKRTRKKVDVLAVYELKLGRYDELLSR
jgi:hypothetical protein